MHVFMLQARSTFPHPLIPICLYCCVFARDVCALTISIVSRTQHGNPCYRLWRIHSFISAAQSTPSISADDDALKPFDIGVRHVNRHYEEPGRGARKLEDNIHFLNTRTWVVRECEITSENEALVDSLVSPGHPSTRATTIRRIRWNDGLRTPDSWAETRPRRPAAQISNQM